MKHFTHFELVRDTIDNLYRFDLSPSGKIVLLYLVNCINRQNDNIVFPSMDKIADKTGLSLRHVARAIKQIQENNLILNTKKFGRNKNKYELNISEFSYDKMSLQNYKNVITGHDKLSGLDMTKSHNHYSNNKEINKQHQQTKGENDQRVSYKSNVEIGGGGENQKTHKRVYMADVPEHIRKDKTIHSPCAFWATLDEEDKNIEIERAKDLEKMKKEKEEQAKQELEEKRQEEEEQRKPFSEGFTPESAKQYIFHLRGMGKERVKRSLNVKELVRAFNLDVDEILDNA